MEVYNLIKERSSLSPESLEWFDSVVLTEVFANVTEHGVSHGDSGWWMVDFSSIPQKT